MREGDSKRSQAETVEIPAVLGRFRHHGVAHYAVTIHDNCKHF